MRWLKVLIAPLLGASVYLACDLISSKQILLGSVPGGTREAMFVAMSGTSGALVGFAVAGITIIVTLVGGPRLAWLNNDPNYKEDVQFLFTSATAGLSICTIIFLALILGGTSKDGIGIGWAMLAAAAFSLAVDRMFRLVRYLHDLMPVAMEDQQGSASVTPNNPPP